MKRSQIMILILCAFLIMLTACNTNENSQAELDNDLIVTESTSAVTENASKITVQNTTAETQSVLPVTDESAESSLDIETEEILSKPLNSSDYVLNASFTPIYENVGFVERNSDGSPTTYEELQDFMPSYGNTSFLEYEIIAQYTPEEAIEKTGKNIFKHTSTLYRAHIYYDHLNDTPVDIIVDLGKAGFPDSQFENNPPYVVGQKIISDLTGFSSTSCVAVPELVYFVYEVNGVKLAYHVDNESIVLESEAFANLDMELTDSERFLVTSTSNNPVKFTQKSTVDDLTDFIRQDWEARGYDFFDVANFDYENRSILATNEDVAVVE